jgi:octaprenyl-diphosphate synthase
MASLRLRVRAAMEASLTENEGLLGEIGLYNFQGGGKLLRPLVFLLALKSLGHEITEERVKESVIFELVHVASLLHDDIVDLSDTRRGRKAAHLAFGVPETVLSGDFLAGTAGRLAVGSGSLAFVGCLQEALLELAQGELQELKARWETDLDEPGYFDIVRRKTASLFVAAALGAGILVKAPGSSLSSLEGLAVNYGLVFQIMDDILDYSADPDKLGKPVLQDITEGRVTLPYILARKNLSPKDAFNMDSLAIKEGKTQDDLDELLAYVAKGNGVALAREEVKRIQALAFLALKGLPNGEPLSILVKGALDRTS